LLTIHHLGVSQSDRIVWLMEELAPYRLVWYDRGRTGSRRRNTWRCTRPRRRGDQDGDLVLASQAQSSVREPATPAGGSVAPRR
jgi:glutathione S-transferase